MNSIVECLQNKSDYNGSNGRDNEDIVSAECELEIKFSSDYREYLREIGLACFDGHELTGLTDIDYLDVVAVSRAQRSFIGDSVADMYVVEDLGIDGLLIWQKTDGTVYETAPGGHLKKIANSLFDYFQSCE